MTVIGRHLPTLKKRAKVVARHDLRDVPEGTAGRVVLVNGMTWIRYWVRFENGVYLGSINRNDLASADEWKRHLAGEDVWGDEVEETEDADDAADADAAAASSGGGSTTPSGTVIPEYLIERSKAARERLGA